MESPPSRKRPGRSLPTRTALMAAGFELLVERPIDGIPIDEVVARAGVAKGSFFNHFRDKQAFAAAIAAEVRRDLETLVTRANEGVDNPLARMAGGMRVAAQFARAEPQRSAVLLRSHGTSTAADHPLNRGLKEDIETACAQGLLHPDARDVGVLYWLGLCQVVMADLVENPGGRVRQQALVRKMLCRGLTGLGAPPALVAEIVSRPGVGTGAGAVAQSNR